MLSHTLTVNLEDLATCLPGSWLSGNMLCRTWGFLPASALSMSLYYINTSIDFKQPGALQK